MEVERRRDGARKEVVMASMRRSGVHRLRWFVAGALSAVVLGGVGWAAVPHSGTGVITACYATTSSPPGRLRVIDAQAGEVCGASEVQLTWNQKGLRFRGAWTATTAYAVNDLVTRSGSTYIALAASTGVAVTDTGTWAVFARKGSAGPSGVVDVLHSSGYVPEPTAVGDWKMVRSMPVTMEDGQVADVSVNVEPARDDGAAPMAATVEVCSRPAGTTGYTWRADGLQVVASDQEQVVSVAARWEPGAGNYDLGVCIWYSTLTGWDTGWAQIHALVATTA